MWREGPLLNSWFDWRSNEYLGDETRNSKGLINVELHNSVQIVYRVYSARAQDGPQEMERN